MWWSEYEELLRCESGVLEEEVKTAIISTKGSWGKRHIL
jgi:hypothetical protein